MKYTSEELSSRFGLPVTLKNKRVLDTNAQDGSAAFEAEKRGAQVLALAPKEEIELLNVEKSKRKSEVNFQAGTIFDVNSHNISVFEVVLLFNVLEHTDEKEKAIEKANSVLASSGILVIETKVDAQYSTKWLVTTLQKLRFPNVYIISEFDGRVTVRGEK